MKPQIRIDNPTKIDHLLIDKDLKKGKLVIIQFSDKTYSDKLLSELNELCLEFDENFTVRFYGIYQNSFDCETLSKLPNLKSLWLEGYLKAYNLKVLKELKNLKRLGLGLLELEDLEILKENNFQNLEELIIGGTKTKAIDLQYLKNYRDLKSLSLCGHTKNIDVVGKLRNLEVLRLTSIPEVSLKFINNLEKLNSLSFLLGGRENLDEIEENEIENLEIIRVQGFNSFKNITNFKNLKNLQIEDQIQFKELDFAQELPNLKDFKLGNCKTFEKLTGLHKLINLNQLRIYKTNIDFDDFINQIFPNSLDILAFYTSKSKIDKEIKERLQKLGYRDGLER
ncbi:MAG TPA: hypothetical protein ENH91_16010 [Leeuwenhoekiella sp.]|nr:hypothetical protein [Leeuwenhoekiella sp.]